jgi:nitrite reductase (NO-forming)
MNRHRLLPTGAAALAATAALVVGFSWNRSSTPEATNFGTAPHPTSPTWLAEVAAPSHARVKEFRIPMTHRRIEIAKGVTYEGWTFGNTVPGPVIRVRQGDLVKVTLVNESPMPHSIDFHSARIPMNVAFRTIMPGQELEFEFEARDPGAFMVHCGTAPVLMHIMQGMYLPIIVDPAGGWGSRADREFVLVQSEFYAQPGADSVMQPDWQAALDDRPTHVVFNGKANQYVEDPLQVNVGDRVRLFVVNAGPSRRSDFHVVGAVFDRVIPDGNPDHAMEHVQTWTVPAGGGAVFETVFAEEASGEGAYAFVTHSFSDASKGAVGLIKVGEVTGHLAAH